jgi:hypothetical protein
MLPRQQSSIPYSEELMRQLFTGFALLISFTSSALTAQAAVPTHPQRDTITVVNINVTSAKTTEKSQEPVDSAYLSQFSDVGVEHAWYTGQPTRGSRAVQINNVDASHCEQRQVEFLFLTGAPLNGAAPSITVHGRWWTELQPLTRRKSHENVRLFGDRVPPNGEFLASHPHSFCYASIRWRLSDNPGENMLRARLVPKDSAAVWASVADSSMIDFTMIGHAPPNIVVGLSWLRGGVRKVRLEPSSDSSTARQDSIKHTRAFQPILGIDFPIVIPSASHRIQRALSGFRPVIATSYGDPGWDLYLGIELLPLKYGSRVMANPLQFSIGSRLGLNHSQTSCLYLAGHISAISAISDFLGGIGVK